MCKKFTFPDKKKNTVPLPRPPKKNLVIFWFSKYDFLPVPFFLARPPLINFIIIILLLYRPSKSKLFRWLRIESLYPKSDFQAHFSWKFHVHFGVFTETFRKNFTYWSIFQLQKLENFHGRVVNFQAHIFTYPLVREGRFQVFQMLCTFLVLKSFLNLHRMSCLPIFWILTIRLQIWKSS